MDAERREFVSDWLIVGGALLLLLSLFLTWSHQFSPAFLSRWQATAALRGVPRDPDAWQVYSAADVLLALLGAVLLAVALRGGRSARLGAGVGCGLALAFTLHALIQPPTNGVTIFDPGRGTAAANAPTAGVGETVALLGLSGALAGLAMSISVPQRGRIAA